MEIEIVAVGDEILSGITVNTNAAFISRQLSQLGYEVQRETVLPDDAAQLKEGLQEALRRASIVIVTGGLGPTIDDHTRQVAAEIFDSPFHFDETIAAEIKRRYGEQLTSLRDQATVPSKAKLLHNRIGTAPGFLFSEKGRYLFLLPGVPPEMKPMFVEEALPLLKKILGQKEPLFNAKIHLCLLPENSVDPALREEQLKFPSVKTGIYPGYGVLTVALSGTKEQEVLHFKESIERRFSTYLFESPSGKIEEALHALCTRDHKKLALAESCTGGFAAALVTAIPGASDYFLGSVVAYSNELKEKMLHVSKATLEHHGAVSRECVLEMAAGLFKTTTADYAIAVSGVAGPTGGTAEKPVGTVWIAIAKRGGFAEALLLRGRGSRETIILMSSIRALGLLYRKIAYNCF